MNIYWLEIKRFLEENKKNIIKGTLFLGVLLGGIITILNQPNSEEEQETEIEDSQEVFENDSRSAFFRFYIEKPDGTAFGNSATMDQLFNLDSLYDEALSETDIDIKKIKELAEEKEIIDFSPVKVKVNGDSNIFVAIFETGENEGNISLANFYYNYLFDSGFNILEDHKIYSLVEPELVEDTEEKEAETKVVQAQKSKSELVKSLIKNLVISFILSFVLSLGVLLIKELFGKKLNFIFSYNIDDFDDFMVYDEKLNNKESVQYFASTPYSVKKLILKENGLSTEDKKLLFNDINVDFDIKNSIVSTSPSNLYEEIIIIVNPYETTRSWFNKQKKLINLHDAETKIIQLNDDLY